MKDLVVKVVEATVVLGLVWLCLNVSGCNTVSGFGKDLQAMSSEYVEQ